MALLPFLVTTTMHMTVLMPASTSMTVAVTMTMPVTMTMIVTVPVPMTVSMTMTMTMPMPMAVPMAMTPMGSVPTMPWIASWATWWRPRIANRGLGAADWVPRRNIRVLARALAWVLAGGVLPGGVLPGVPPWHGLLRVLRVHIVAGGMSFTTERKGFRIEYDMILDINSTGQHTCWRGERIITLVMTPHVEDADLLNPEMGRK